MSKPVKDMMTREYQDSFGELDSACVVSLTGLDANSNNQFRGDLQAKNIRIQVVKNSLARRAFASSPLAPLAQALDGPCALVTGGESVIDLAKALVAAKKSYPKIELRMGIIEGDPALIDVEQMATFKSKTETLGEIAMLLMSPARSLAGAINGPGGRLAGCLKAMADKEGDAEAA